MGHKNSARFLRSAVARSAIASERGLETRNYQIDLASRALRTLRSGHNVAVTLPTGAGKTMIADLVARAWLDHYPSHTILSIVPRRVLTEQHRHHAQWLKPPLQVSALGSSERRHVNRKIRDNDIVITTPRLLGNAAFNDRLQREYLATLQLVIVDEVDAFLSTTWTDTGVAAELHESLRLLISYLPRPRFLLLTGTPPEVTASTTTDDQAAMADALAATFGVRTWKTASERAIQRYMPAAMVLWTPVRDPHVQDLDEALDNEIRIVFDDIDALTPDGADRDYIRRRYRELGSGRVHSYLTATGRRLPVPDSVRELCVQLTRRYGQRLFLYEDDFAGYTTYLTTYRGQSITRLSGPDDGRYRAELSCKFDAVCDIVDAHPTASGILFVRYLTVADMLASRLTSHGRSVRVLHGELSDTDRSATREWFRNSEAGILILTRDTGRRGLDIPEADFAVFYSPKRSSATMWQEMSRIRATTSNLKPSYILVYEGTSESSKAEVVADEMNVSSRWYDQRVHNV